MDDDGSARLGRAVKNRRLELGLSVRAAAVRAGINRATWGTLEEGDRRLSTHLRNGVEKALSWAPGSIGAVLAGHDPTPLAESTETTRPPSLPPDFDLNAEIERAAQLDVPAQTRLAIIRSLIDLYEEAGGSVVRPPTALEKKATHGGRQAG